MAHFGHVLDVMFDTNDLDVYSDDEMLPLALMAIEEEDELITRRRRIRRCGSTPGHAIIQRDRAQGHERLFNDYFSERPVYPSHFFRRRFRMRRPLFLRIQSAIEAHDRYFIQRRDACGVLGLSSLQKMAAAIRMLAYGVSADLVDDHIRIGESTAIESLRHFVKAIVGVFGDEYLRSPNNNDITRLLATNEDRGFPGMLGSIDCMHWKWKNCPAGWQGMYTGHIHKPTIILEAVASHDLWIWHAFFGLPGALNDINVLHRSTIFHDLANGRAPKVNYSINGNNYTMGYYLADGIYPEWSTFVKTIPFPQGNKNKYFAEAQESARKDVERAFGVLQARFAIVRGPARFWDQETLHDIMTACIIMHNMIVEDEREDNNKDFNYDAVEESPSIEVSHDYTPELLTFIQTHHRIRDKRMHSQLQLDLVEHLWQRHGQ